MTWVILKIDIFVICNVIDGEIGPQKSKVIIMLGCYKRLLKNPKVEFFGLELTRGGDELVLMCDGLMADD